MKRRITLIAVVVLIVGLIGAASIVLHTGFALRWTLAVIRDRSAGILQIGAEEGTLAGPVILHDVQIKTTDFTAHIQRLTLDWVPLDLLANRLNVTALQADDVDVTVTPSTNNQPFHFGRPVPPHLPLVLVINKLSINRVHVTTPQLAEPIQITHVDAMARFDNRSWRIPSLSIDGKQIHILGQGNWEFRHGNQLGASLDWKLALPQLPPVSGKASINGDEKQLRLNLGLQVPLHMQLDAEVQNLFDAPTWRGKLGFRQLHLQQLAGGLPDIEARGAAHFSGNPAATDFEGELNAHEPETGDWLGRFALQYKDSQLEVRQLDLARATTHTRFQLKGKVDLAGAQPAPDLQGEWQALALPLTGKAWLVSPRGNLRVQSRAQRITLNLDGALSKGGKFSVQGNVDMGSATHPWQLSASAQHFHLALPSMPEPLPGFDWRLQAHGDSQRTLIENLAVTGFGGELHLQGSYQHGASHNWQATLTAKHLDPGMVFADYRGDIGFEARLNGSQGAAPHCSLILKSLHGTLRAESISAHGSVQCIPGKWLFKDVEAQIAKNHIRFDGHLGRKSHFDWDIAAPELKALWPGLQGTLDSSGSVELEGANPVARFKLHAADLHYRDYAIATLDADVAMSDTSQAGAATFKASNIIINDLGITQLTARANGSLSAHSLQLKLDSPFGKATLVGDGSFANDIWQGDLQTVTLEPAGAGVWQAETAWHPRIGAEGISLPQACVMQIAARACGNISWHRRIWHANAKLEAIPLHDLQALLPPGLEYAGSFAGELQASGDATQHSMDLKAALSPGSIHNVIRHQRVALLDYTQGNAHIHIDGVHTTGSLNWSLTDGGYLNVDTRIAQSGKAALSGH
ncbi:MAG: hypothetical protein ACRETO_04615, partial [Gammaproteobacteria bacterium]